MTITHYQLAAIGIFCAVCYFKGFLYRRWWQDERRLRIMADAERKIADAQISVLEKELEAARNHV